MTKAKKDNTAPSDQPTSTSPAAGLSLEESSEEPTSSAASSAVLVEFDTDNEGFQIRSKAIVEELNRLGVKAEIAFVDETKRTSRLVVPFKELV